MTHDPLALLRARIEAANSQKLAADALGVSEAYLSDIVRGHKAPGPKILNALGLERVVTYREKGK